MNTWHFDNKDYSSILLWRIGDICFQVTGNGNYAYLIVNGNYVLTERKLKVCSLHLETKLRSFR